MNIFRMIHFARHYDKKNETNRQMLTRISIKFFVLFFIVFMFDTLLDWFLSGIHFLLELLHLLSESIEYMIEVMLENTFQTSSQQSDVIIVNGAVIIGLYALYRVYLVAPKLCDRFKQILFSIWLRWIRGELTYWQTLPFSQKVNLILLNITGFGSLLFLLTV